MNVVLDPTSKQKQLEAAITPVADRLLKKLAAAKSAHADAVEHKDEKAIQVSKNSMDAQGPAFPTNPASDVFLALRCPTMRGEA